LERTLRCDYEHKTNRYISFKHTHVIFYSEMTNVFCLNMKSSGHHYKNTKIK